MFEYFPDNYEEHCQVDDPTLAIDAVGDWLQAVLRCDGGAHG